MPLSVAVWRWRRSIFGSLLDDGVVPSYADREKRKSSSFSSMMATFLRLLPTMMKGTDSTAEVAVSKLTAVGAATQGGPVPLRTLWDMTQGGRRAALCYLCSTGVNLVDF